MARCLGPRETIGNGGRSFWSQILEPREHWHTKLYMSKTCSRLRIEESQSKHIFLSIQGSFGAHDELCSDNSLKALFKPGPENYLRVFIMFIHNKV